MSKWIVLAIGAATGAALGFGYWNFIGCSTGSCPITSSPVNSSVYGAVLGVLTVNLFLKPGK